MSTPTTTTTDTKFDDVLNFDLQGTLAGYWLVAVRLITGYWFLHAGWNKFAFVSGESFDAAGYLLNGTTASPLHGFFAWAAATPWLMEFTNFMIPTGEFLIGLGLIVGGLVRLASFFGAVLMVFFYLGNADWAHGLVNGDLMGLVLFVTVATFGAGRILGLDAYLEKFDFAKTKAAKFILG
ncbi:doxx protein [Halogeometricum borinquense DSM 11551]|uniref:DoxX protein n=2 Tax=Halogeometricum borinquense TaxID=60847 RepID=E4NMI8_HALBP|nr:DoxX family protein [Halogeometricum borinquense]ADQ68486.1 DoxX protein [Halogeometricum borinquense DSM 11551]ELY27870.1 doxx protein [Halogeometricum borinquense DSM 11551]RYJ14985.1 DoxX family protein [Halogeometricum borinquense]